MFYQIATINDQIDSTYNILPVKLTSKKRDSTRKKNIYDLNQNVHAVFKQKYKGTSIKKVHQVRQHRQESRVNSPLSLDIETLVVADLSIFNDHKRFIDSDDESVIFGSMQVYLAHLFNGVCFADSF